MGNYIGKINMFEYIKLADAVTLDHDWLGYLRVLSLHLAQPNRERDPAPTSAGLCPNLFTTTSGCWAITHAHDVAMVKKAFNRPMVCGIVLMQDRYNTNNLGSSQGQPCHYGEHS